MALAAAEPQPAAGAAPAITGGWDAHLHVFDGRPLPDAHYQAPACTLAAWAGLAQPQGIYRALLVQPSVYGADNGLLLQTLADPPGRHRGVVVLAGDESDAQLDQMADAGVRGVRLNLVSRPGMVAGLDTATASATTVDSDPLLRWLAPRLRARGWFAQWYLGPAQWLAVARWSARQRILPVLDHLAGVTPTVWAAGGAARALAPLADAGGWLKLSGWYRLQAEPPYDALLPAVQGLHRVFDGRCLWGSDWPHTRFMEPDASAAPPVYASLLAPLQAALGPAAAQAVLHHMPARLLG